MHQSVSIKICVLKIVYISEKSLIPSTPYEYKFVLIASR